jgi:hypothetical protein
MNGHEAAMNPYRVPSPPPLPPPNDPVHRPTDALDVLFWAVVATLGLAMASGRGPVAAPHPVQLEAR